MLADEEQERATVRTYDDYADALADRHADRGEYKAVVAKLQKFLPKGEILEIGAGGGYDAELLTDAGYTYFGTDVSMGTVAVARARHPNFHFEQLSVYDLGKLRRQFDGFWACAVLLHIPKNRIDEALQAIAAVTKDGGFGFISLKDGDEEKFEDREKLGRQEKRLFVYWRRDEFEEALKRNDFSIADYEYIPISERTNWHRFIVQKRVE